jgi:hypothetical protein
VLLAQLIHVAAELLLALRQGAGIVVELDLEGDDLVLPSALRRLASSCSRVVFPVCRGAWMRKYCSRSMSW